MRSAGREMMKGLCCAVVLVASATAEAQGIFSGLFGGNRDEAAPQQGNVTVTEGSDPNQGVRPQQTPTQEQIKKGAAKLAKQLNHERIPGDLFRQYAGTWKGWFYTYTLDGRSTGRQAVQMQCDLQSDGSLLVRAMYFDKLAQQFVLGESYHYQKVDPSTIKVTITRASNDTQTQTGHFNDGSLFLRGNIADGVEGSRERIDGNRLLMDGFSVYFNKKGENDVHHHVARLTREK